MIVTPDMHERKRLMFERSDAFVALPGGVGTLEELVEQLTWKQARPSRQAGTACQHRQFLGAAVLAARRTCARPSSSAPASAVDILKADRVEDILPQLKAAVAQLAEALEKQMLARRGAQDVTRHFACGNVTASIRLPSGSTTKVA